MERFNKKGIMIIPNPIKKEDIVNNDKVLVVNELYCPNGHNLISKSAIFNTFPGILIKGKKGEKTGYLALSPIYGAKSSICFDIDMKEGDIIEIFCPFCDTKLPIYSQCVCKADIVAFFLNKQNDYANCVGICNRAGCQRSQIIESGNLIPQSLIDNF
ncbi:MAG: hypothetical protein K8R58_13160 [Bacteroidales bacterium]|nr:hypothetical protein [Bacteroidales bacterium]